MTIQEAYEIITWKKTNRKIAPSTIRKNFDEKKLRERRDDLLYGLIDNTDNASIRLVKDIEHSYEFLLKYLQDEKYDEREDDYELLSYSASEKTNQQLAFTYKQKFLRAKDVKHAQIMSEMVRLTDEYHKMMTFHCSALELNNLRNEYLERIKELKLIDQKNETTFQKIIKSFDDFHNLNLTVLEKFLEKNLGDNYHELLSDSFYWRVKKIKESNYSVVLEPTYKKVSEINSILITLRTRLSEAYRLYCYILTIKEYESVKKSNELLSNEFDLVKRHKILSECEKEISEIAKSLEDCKKKYKIYKVILDGLNEDYIDDNVLMAIDDEIKGIITSKYLDILNDPELFKAKCEEYEQVKREDSIVAKKYVENGIIITATGNKTASDEMINDVRAYYQLLVNITTKIGKDTIEIDFDKEISIKEAAFMVDMLKNEIYQSQIDAVKFYWGVMIDSYLSNYFDIKGNEMSYYDDLYQSFITNVNDREYVEYYYYVFDDKYKSFMKTNPETKNLYETIASAIKIKMLIDDLKLNIDKLGFELDEDMLNLYNQMKDLSLAELYHLYNTLNKYYMSCFTSLDVQKK